MCVQSALLPTYNLQPVKQKTHLYKVSIRGAGQNDATKPKPEFQSQVLNVALRAAHAGCREVRVRLGSRTDPQPEDSNSNVMIWRIGA